MKMVILDSDDRMMVEYDHQKIKELLVKYIGVLGDVEKAFDQVSEDLMDRARSVK